MNGTFFPPTAINHIQKKGIWAILLVLLAIFVSIAIVDEEWLYLSVLSAPFLIYYFMKKPFIYLFGVYVFLLPFEGVLDSSSGVNLTKVIGALLILVLSINAAFQNKLKKPNNVAIWWILFVLFCSLSMTWAIQSGVHLMKIATPLSLLLLYLITVSYKIEKREYDALKWFIFTGGLAAALILIYNYANGDFVNVYRFKSSVTFNGEETGSDFQAFYLLFPISIGILLMLEQKKKITQVLLLIATFTIIMGVIATGTRGALMAISAIMIVYMKYVKKKMTLGIVLLIAILIIIPLIPQHFVSNLGNSLDDRGSGRLDIWMVGLHSLDDYWILGAGFKNFSVAYDQFVDSWPNIRVLHHILHRASHNIFLNVFVELGIFGFILLMISLIGHYRSISSRFIHDDKNQVMLRAAFWGIMIQSFFLDTLWSKSFWLLWMMILMYRNVVTLAHCEKNYFLARARARTVIAPAGKRLG
jgi:O-antigen ligase